MWADVQKGCGMGLGGYADLRVPSFVHTTLHTMHTILHTIFGHSVQLKSWFIRGFRGMLTLYTCVRNQRDQRWCVTAVEA